MFGFDDDSSRAVCPALVRVAPEGVNVLGKGIEGHKNSKRSGNTMNESHEQCHLFNLFKL